jgi:hypothetical protein
MGREGGDLPVALREPVIPSRVRRVILAIRARPVFRPEDVIRRHVQKTRVQAAREGG